MFVGHGPQGAGACRALCVESVFRHRGQPWHDAHPVLLADREQQQQLILTPASAIPAPVQRHEQYCSVCEATRHKRTHTHNHTHTHTHAHMPTHTNAHEHIQACTRKITGTHTPTDTHAHIHTHKHTHAHMHMHAYVARVMGFANFSVSLATLPHL